MIGKESLRERRERQASEARARDFGQLMFAALLRGTRTRKARAERQRMWRAA